MTTVSFPCKATLAIGQTRVVLSMEVAGVTIIVTKTVANVMTSGVMMHGVMQKKICTMVSYAPLTKVAVTPGGLTRAAIGGVGATGMTRLTQGRMQCCSQLRNQWE